MTHKRLYCWPCGLFERTAAYYSNPWVTTEFANVSDLARAVERHEKSESLIHLVLNVTEIVGSPGDRPK